MTAEELLQLLRSDECYYEVANAKQSAWSAIEEACDWAADKMQAEEEAQAKIDNEVAHLMEPRQIEKCSCGNSLPPYDGPGSCSPSRCSHRDAADALWGD